MKKIALVLSLIVPLPLVAVLACERSDETVKRWTKGVTKNSEFAPWVGGSSIKLPADREHFLIYLNQIKASWYLAGDIKGAEMPVVPPPFDRQLCNGARAIGFRFAFDKNLSAAPKFVAYLDENDRVVCVENQTVISSF